MLPKNEDDPLKLFFKQIRQLKKVRICKVSQKLCPEKN